jgi:hypothetical protein
MIEHNTRFRIVFLLQLDNLGGIRSIVRNNGKRKFEMHKAVKDQD